MNRSFNPEKELRKIQGNNKNKIVVGIIFLLIIVAIGTSFALYQVQNKQDIVFTKVGNFGGDYIIAAYIDGEKVSDFPENNGSYIVNNIVCNNDAIGKWDYEKWGINITNTSKTETKCNIYFYNVYKDNSGANAPILLNNMIPIKYDGSNWIYANKAEKWYDYDAKEWANAVVLNDGVNKNVGDVITEEEIALWYVWIPRYTYTIFNGNNGSVAEQEIQIKFESGTNSSGTVKCIDNVSGSGDSSEVCVDPSNGGVTNNVSTYTHPAFTFGDEELTGFWVGKFEVGGTINKIEIRPNITSLSNQNLSSFFMAIQNITTQYNINGDSHMMKNMEWGAVAYLTQSKYGRCTNGVCEEISRNNNSSFITGYAAVNAATTGLSETSVSTNEFGTDLSITQPYNTEVGIKASTTGNIYGIYDMSGGVWEFVMGGVVDSSGLFYNNRTGFTAASIPSPNYYDSYTYDTLYTPHFRGKLGDATKETRVNVNPEYGGWYGDCGYFPSEDLGWVARGGPYNYGTGSGIFYFTRISGANAIAWGTRSALS